MIPRRRLLAVRRGRLRAESARLRAELAVDATALGERLRLVDELVAAARSGFARAALIVAGVWLVFGRRGRILSLAARAVVVWPFVRPLVPHLLRLVRQR